MFIRSSANPISTPSSTTTSAPLRCDGRSHGEIRSIKLTFGRTIHGRAECTVQYGSSTRTVSIITCELVPPTNVDTRPNDGVIVFNVDLSPMGCMGYEAGGGGAGGDSGQKLESNRIARCIERIVKEGGVIDLESLCVVGGGWVWKLSVDIVVIDSGGNMLDVCALSAIAALRHFRLPAVLLSDESSTGTTPPVVLSADHSEPTPLPLHHTPVCISFGLFGDPTGITTTVAALIDTTSREELVMDGVITLAYNKHGEMCLFDYPGGCELKPRQLMNCAKLAKQKAVDLCDLLETALKTADEKAIQDRMMTLRALYGNQEGDDTTVPPDVDSNVPFVEMEDHPTLSHPDGLEGVQDIGKDAVAKARADAQQRNAEDEMYRKQALDYSVGHVAAKVKEDADDPKKKQTASATLPRPPNDFGNNLIRSMLRSAQRANDIAAAAAKTSTTTASGSNDEHNTPTTADASKDEAMEEFEHFAAKAMQSDTTKTKAVTVTSKPMDTAPIVTTTTAGTIDSDDEEPAVLHKSEFGATTTASQPAVASKPTPVTKTKTKTSDATMTEVDDDVDDLAMAVIKKKKKKKSKKK